MKNDLSEFISCCKWVFMSMAIEYATGLLTLVNQDPDIAALQVSFQSRFKNVVRLIQGLGLFREFYHMGNGHCLGCPPSEVHILNLSMLKKLGPCGMQVKTKEGKWIWVQPIQGTFVVNIGDMLMVCVHPTCPLTSVWYIKLNKQDSKVKKMEKKELLKRWQMLED